jgi:hypothetical protein
MDTLLIGFYIAALGSTGTILFGILALRRRQNSKPR